MKTRILLSFVVAILVTTIIYAGSFLEATGFSFWQLPISFIIVFFLWQLQLLIAKKLDRKLAWKTNFLKRLLSQIVACFFVSFSIINLIYLVFKLYSIKYIEDPGSRYNVYIFLLVNSIFFILFLLVTGLHLGFTFIQQWQESLLLAGKLKEQNNQAKIIGYRQQLNPHFVFNNLNILTAIIEKDPVSAKLFVEQFSISYRYLIQGTDKELIPLYTELQFIDSYIYLLKVRFQDCIRFSLCVAETDKKLFIPPFSLQLLIENCVKHNITSLENPLTIEMFSSNQTITVKNNLQLKTLPESSTATGLKNILSRYSILSDLPVLIEKTNSHFSVTLPLLESDENTYY